MFCLTLIGCGGNPTYPVRGQLVYPDGTPAKELQGYVITMESTEQPTGANGVVGPDGSFEVGTFKDYDGAVLGKHRVAITPPRPQSDTPPPPSLIHARYKSLEKSGIEIIVKPEKNAVQIEVEKARK